MAESLLLKALQSVDVNRPVFTAEELGVTTPQLAEPGAQSGSNVSPGW